MSKSTEDFIFVQIYPGGGCAQIRDPEEIQKGWDMYAIPSNELGEYLKEWGVKSLILTHNHKKYLTFDNEEIFVFVIGKILSGERIDVYHKSISVCRRHGFLQDWSKTNFYLRYCPERS